MYHFPTYASAKGKITVAVDELGIILNSDDSLHWSNTTIDTVNKFRSITRTDTQFVAVGEKGVIFTSVDGKDWNTIFSRGRTKLNDIIYQNHKFIAVGDLGTIKTSADGITWTLSATGATSIGNVVITGTGMNSQNVVYSSEGGLLISQDGIHWIDESEPYAPSDYEHRFDNWNPGEGMLGQASIW